jgi:hypothetical protein
MSNSSHRSSASPLAAGYLLVDYYTPLSGTLRTKFVNGIHPNAAGYAVMEKALSGVVLY